MNLTLLVGRESKDANQRKLILTLLYLVCYFIIKVGIENAYISFDIDRKFKRLNRNMKFVWMVPILTSLLLIPSKTSSQENTISDKAFDQAYKEGRLVFYKMIKKNILSLPLNERDREKLKNAEKKIPKLFEHLKNLNSMTNSVAFQFNLCYTTV